MAKTQKSTGLESIDLESLKALLKEEIKKEMEEEEKAKKEKDREDLRKEIKQELENEAHEIEETSKRQIKIRKDVDLNRYVEVRSVCTGTLTVITKLDSYSFYEYGAVQDITIGELKSLKNSNPTYFTSPMFIIEDEEAVEVCGMTDFYKKISFINNLPMFFKNSTEEDVIKTLQEIPQYLKMEIVTRLKIMWENNEFRDSDVLMFFKKHMNYDISE